VSINSEEVHTLSVTLNARARFSLTMRDSRPPAATLGSADPDGADVVAAAPCNIVRVLSYGVTLQLRAPSAETRQSAGSLYPLARGCRRSWRGEGCNYGFGGAVADFVRNSWLRGPRFAFTSPLAREGADGQAVVCPLLRGSSPTRGVAPKQHRTRRLLTNRPCSSLVYEESDSKERLRVSNWIVQRLYNYAVKKTVEL
jgi:hypothetical protein